MVNYAPPFIEIPTLISRDFFCLFPQCWRGSASFPLERQVGSDVAFYALTPHFLSLFSAGLLSVQVVASSKFNGLQRPGCTGQALRDLVLTLRILPSGRKKAASRAAIYWGAVSVAIRAAPVLLVERSTLWAGRRRE